MSCVRKYSTIIGFWEVEESNPFFIESNIPTHHNVVLGLGFLQLLVIICLQFHQGSKNVLVLVSIVISTMYAK